MIDISWLAVGPVVVLTAAVVLILLFDAFGGSYPLVWTSLTGAGMVSALVLAVAQWAEASDQAGLHWSGMVALDPFGAFGTVALVLVAGLGFMLAWPLAMEQGERAAEFVSLVLLALAGAVLMVIGANLIVVFVGLEVMSISFYILAGFARVEPASDEAAVKYFLLGSFASAVFVYGVALAFAAAGSLSVYGIAAYLATNVILEPAILLGSVALLVVGLGFKVSAAPFHMWAPDVYQGAASGISGYMAAGAKLAGFAALARILTVGFEEARPDWAPAVAAVAAISVIVGTIYAIGQTDIKRMLAYSSVAHAGFILTGLVAGEAAVPWVWFYTFTYVITVVGAFGVVAVVSGFHAGRSPLTDYAGLSRRAPFLAGVLTLMMLSMGGIPLTSGFLAKVGVFREAVDAGYLWLVVVAVVASVAALFFYLRVVVLMYMQAPTVVEAPGAAAAVPETNHFGRFALTAATVITVAFGIVPGPLLDVVDNALPF